MIDLRAGSAVGNQWFDEPPWVPVEGGRLERVREYYNFWLGTRLSRIDGLHTGLSMTDTIVLLFPVGDALNQLMQNKFENLPMCAEAGVELMRLVQSVMPTNPEAVTSWKLTDYQIVKIREAAKAFDTALSIQFDHLDTYRVMPKGTHDTRKLIERPELAFEDLWKYLVDLAQTDWKSASRCLAFDLPTACGFHAIRAMEAQVLGYLKLRHVTPTKRDLGAYVGHLRAEKASLESINLVDHLRANHRNPLMHPEDTLDITEALAVFDLTKAAITYLILDAKAKGMVT